MLKKLPRILIWALLLQIFSIPFVTNSYATPPACLTITDNVVTSGATCTGAIVIPDGVTEIGNSAFMSSTVETITAPASLRIIGVNAFYRVDSLTALTLNSGLTTINSSAFAEVKLTSLTIPNSVTTLGYGAFYGITTLTSLTIGTGITEIPDSAFTNSRITSLTIPNQVTTIGPRAFSGSQQLTSVTLGTGLVSIGASAFQNASLLSAVTIPNSVKSIGTEAFAQSNISALDLGSSLETIGNAAFYGARSTTLTIPNSVKTIGNQAFEGLSNLTTLTIGTGVESIGAEAFKGAVSLTSLTLSEGLKTIGNNAFQNATALTSVTIPQSVLQLPTNSFTGAGVTIEPSVFDRVAATKAAKDAADAEAARVAAAAAAEAVAAAEAAARAAAAAEAARQAEIRRQNAVSTISKYDGGAAPTIDIYREAGNYLIIPEVLDDLNSYVKSLPADRRSDITLIINKTDALRTTYFFNKLATKVTQEDLNSLGIININSKNYSELLEFLATSDVIAKQDKAALQLMVYQINSLIYGREKGSLSATDLKTLGIKITLPNKQSEIMRKFRNQPTSVFKSPETVQAKFAEIEKVIKDRLQRTADAKAKTQAILAKIAARKSK